MLALGATKPIGIASTVGQWLTWLPNLQWLTIDPFRKESNATGLITVLQRLEPDITILVVFAPEASNNSEEADRPTSYTCLF